MEERRLIEVNDDWDTLSGDPCFVEAYVGIRCWRWNAIDGIVYLQSIARQTDWPELHDYHADCYCTEQCILRFGHVCGIYAWHWRDPMPTKPEPMAGRFVWGEVALWGDVHIHENGIRASRARVTGFFVSPMQHRLTNMRAEMAAAQYHVPPILGGAVTEAAAA